MVRVSAPARSFVAIVALGLGLAGAGCGGVSVDRDGPPTESERVAEAVEFGGLALPPSAEPLGVEYERGQDVYYALAVGMAPADRAAHLDGSGFTGELTEGRPVGHSPVAGFDLDAATDFASGADVREATDAHPHAVHRRVLVDQTDPGRTVVHWWLFTT